MTILNCETDVKLKNENDGMYAEWCEWPKNVNQIDKKTGRDEWIYVDVKRWEMWTERMRKCSTRISVTRISGRGKCVMNDRNRKKNKVNCEQADTQRTTALMIIIYITISIPRESVMN